MERNIFTDHDVVGEGDARWLVIHHDENVRRYIDLSAVTWWEHNVSDGYVIIHLANGQSARCVPRSTKDQDEYYEVGNALDQSLYRELVRA